MFHKALFFGDYDAAKEILSATRGVVMKGIGRRVKNFDAKEWDKVAVQVMTAGCMAKFEQNKDAKDALLATGDATIVEASPYDTLWGVGLHATDPLLLQGPKAWKGENLLGQVLMDVRSKLRPADHFMADYNIFGGL
jgi:ribA/ribD-fused uncharacterized protein